MNDEETADCGDETVVCPIGLERLVEECVERVRNDLEAYASDRKAQLEKFKEDMQQLRLLHDQVMHSLGTLTGRTTDLEQAKIAMDQAINEIKDTVAVINHTWKEDVQPLKEQMAGLQAALDTASRVIGAANNNNGR